MSLPLDTEDIVLPDEANPSHKNDGAEKEGAKGLLPADENLDDIYKEVLKIQPGSPHDGIFFYSLLSLLSILSYNDGVYNWIVNTTIGCRLN